MAELPRWIIDLCRSQIHPYISESAGMRSIAANLPYFLNPGDGKDYVIGTACFLNAMVVTGLQKGSAGPSLRNSSNSFAAWLSMNRSSDLELVLSEYYKGQRTVSGVLEALSGKGRLSVSEALQFRFDRASEIAVATVRRKKPDLRHVLAALLVEGNYGKVLLTIPSALLADETRWAYAQVLLGDILREPESGENLQAWRILLTKNESESSGALSELRGLRPASPSVLPRKSAKAPAKKTETKAAPAAPTPPQHDPAALLARLWGDTALGDSPDLLKIDDEVSAFAQLIAAKDTQPPLSIGLFGEWGSGKSFFMERVVGAVTKLSESAEPRCKEAFHRTIVQIRFNAWHYVETNLWASLVEHIFRELDAWLRKGEATAAENLFESLTTSKQLRFEAARALVDQLVLKEQAAARVKTAQNEETAARKTAVPSAADLWQSAAAAFAAAIPAGDKAKIATLERDLGIEGLQKDAQALATIVKEAGNESDRMRLVTRSILTTLGTDWRVWIAAVALFAVPWAVELLHGALVAWFPQATWLDVQPLISGAASVLSVLVVCGRWLLQRGNQAVAVLDGFKARLDEALESQVKAQRQATQAAQQALEAARGAVTQAEAQLAAATAQAAEAECNFHSESARGRLNRFIRERVADSTYARHLTLVATIRRDFSQLTEMMSPQKDSLGAEELERTRAAYQSKLDEFINGKGAILPQPIKDSLAWPMQPGAPNHFDRIVLYIDDLDRCSHDKVSEVLQAIHLLLFFRLFVVVVAVDARWMALSLEKKYDDLLAKREKAGDTLRSATAQDYIEKIFQIPFWVQDMTPDSSRAFIRGLASTRIPAPAGPQTDAERLPAVAGVTPGAAGSETRPPAGQRTAPSGTRPPPPAADPPFAPVSFTADELGVLEKFAPLIATSPRRAKRILNVYQLLKIGLHIATPSEWDSHCCAAIMTLLALLDDPRVADAAFFEALERADVPSRQSIANLQGAYRGVAGTDAPESYLKDVLAALAQCASDPAAEPIEPIVAKMRRLAPTVRRYSFDGRL